MAVPERREVLARTHAFLQNAEQRRRAALSIDLNELEILLDLVMRWNADQEQAIHAMGEPLAAADDPTQIPALFERMRTMVRQQGTAIRQVMTSRDLASEYLKTAAIDVALIEKWVLSTLETVRQLLVLMESTDLEKVLEQTRQYYDTIFEKLSQPAIRARLAPESADPEDLLGKQDAASFLAELSKNQ